MGDGSSFIWVLVFSLFVYIFFFINLLFFFVIFWVYNDEIKIYVFKCYKVYSLIGRIEND